MIFIEQAYDPTELRGDEDETFHQDDAARVSMNRMDMMVAIKELPEEAGGGADKENTCRELLLTSQGCQMSDLITALKTWRRPIEIKMRR